MEAEGRMTAGPTQVPVDPCLEALHMALAMESCASHTSEIPRHTAADAHPKKGGFELQCLTDCGDSSCTLINLEQICAAGVRLNARMCQL